MIEKDIEIVENFLDITEVVLPKYSTAKSKYCVTEEFKISTDNVLNELYKYKMISDRLAEKLELLIISIYHKEEILSINTDKVKEYYENNKSIKSALIKECEEELVCFLRERGRR